VKNFRSPRTWIRLTGDALVAIPLKQEGPHVWSGRFTFPFSGSYSLETHWYGCGFEGENSSMKLLPPMQFEVFGSGTNGTAWISSKRLFTLPSSAPSYLWMNYTTHGPSNTATFLPTKSSIGDSLISREATPISAKGIQDLSNHELVCWIGSKSSTTVYEAFISLLTAIAPHQRPFKFWCPDKEWYRYPDEKEKFLKCKNVFVSIDALKYPISQAQYKSQFQTFVNRILKALGNKTPPIWIATVNLHPMDASTFCHSPEKSSQEHPCNNALRELFLEGAFPDHVHLMDNTDVTSPQSSQHLKDIFAVIAMRWFALVANQVDVWKQAGQVV